MLITYYNERELLRECLDSLFAGSQAPDEVVVYDDASTFPAQGFVPRGLPVKVIRGEANRGPSYGRNLLAQTSAAEYVHFHDADDLFDPQWCARVKASISESGADAIFTEVSSYREERLVREHVVGLHRLATERDLIGFWIDGVMLPASGTYRREAVLAIGGYQEDMLRSEDYELWHPAGCIGNQFCSYHLPAGEAAATRAKPKLGLARQPRLRRGSRATALEANAGQVPSKLLGKGRMRRLGTPTAGSGAASTVGL